MGFSFLPPPSLPHFHPEKNVGQAGGKWGRSNCSWNSPSCPLPACPIFTPLKTWGKRAENGGGAIAHGILLPAPSQPAPFSPH